MDSTRKHFISTHNTTLEGTNPHGKRHWREIESEEHEGTEVYFHYTKRPKLVEHYFDSAKIINVHNYARQSGLSLETSWGAAPLLHPAGQAGWEAGRGGSTAEEMLASTHLYTVLLQLSFLSVAIL